MEWSPQQDQALRVIERWVKDPKAPQVLRVFGWAGTGKSTLAKEADAMVGGGALYLTYTGKASMVLRKKGCPGASTIHSSIYKVREDSETGKLSFVLNAFDSPVARAPLVVVDEVSMVDEELGSDLLSFGTKVLVLGDPFQLPPIQGDGFFTSKAPDVMLTEIHRQAADNPIIRMSMDVREGRRLKAGHYGESIVMERDEISTEQVAAAGQVIVGMNRTRRVWNKRIRRARGLEGPMPVLGDRLVCLRNNRTKGLLNGSLWEPQKIEINEESLMVGMTVASLDDPGAIVPVDVKTPVQYFLGTEEELHWRERKKADEFTYGWALTCHKAQGSQWDHVLVFDESHVFGENANKWLYTGLTRAAERVTVVKDLM